MKLLLKRLEGQMAGGVCFLISLKRNDEKHKGLYLRIM
jgi:hypothetical protein